MTLIASFVSHVPSWWLHFLHSEVKLKVAAVMITPDLGIDVAVNLHLRGNLISRHVWMPNSKWCALVVALSTIGPTASNRCVDGKSQIYYPHTYTAKIIRHGYTWGIMAKWIKNQVLTYKWHVLHHLLHVLNPQFGLHPGISTTTTGRNSWNNWDLGII